MERTKHPSLDFPGHRKNRFITTRRGVSRLNRLTLRWWNAFPPKGFGVLTTWGRKTGREGRWPVRVIRRDDNVFLVSILGEEAIWLHNIRANPNVRIRLKGGTFEGTAREIVEAAEKEEARRAYCETVNGFEYCEAALHLEGLPTRAKIMNLHERWFREGIPLVIDLSSRASSP